jgi:hypothetical protein
MRSAWLVIAFVGACGGQTEASNGTDKGVGPSGEVDEAGSDTNEIPDTEGQPLTCPAAAGAAINVYGVDCYAGGPPSGACSEGAPTCMFCALPALCSPTFGPRTSYSCMCTGGFWSCTVAWQDTGICLGD